MDELTLWLVDQTFGTEPLAIQSDALAQVETRPAAIMHPADIEVLNLDPGGAVTFSTGRRPDDSDPDRRRRVARGVVVVPRHHRLAWRIFE